MEVSAAISDEIPDLLNSDAERALSDALPSRLADRCGLDKALARVESAQTYDDKLWQAVAADLGCAGLLIPERDGGAGASYREAAAAAEVLGSHLAPVPFLGSAVVATAALLSAGSQGGLLAKMADGGVTAALAVPFAPGPGSGFPASVPVAGPQAPDAGTRVARRGGVVSGAADALPASVLPGPAGGRPA